LKHILFISHSGERTGATLVLSTIVENLNRSEYEATVLLPESSELAREIAGKGIRVCVVENPQESIAATKTLVGAARLLVARLRYTRRVYSMCRNKKYDLIYINSLINVFPGIAGLLSGKRIIWHIHETFPATPLNRFKAWIVKRCSKAIVFASPTCRRLFEPIGRRIRAEFIPNGIAAADFREPANTNSVYQELRLPENAVIVSTIGYIHTIKGVDVLLRAASGIIEEIPSAHFLLVGDRSKTPPKYNHLLETIIRDHELGGRVTFAGTRDDIPAILAISHLFVLPSRMESFPVVLLEAMAAETPIIATRVGCVEEILDFGTAGVIVDSDNPEQLARAMIALLKDESRAEEFARAAHQRVMSEYSLETFLERIQRTIDAVAP
jgi:glycosyltransferase involved in cell wall biosynthesis